MERFNYIACLKTSVSEFRAIEHLSDKTKNIITPLFEITKGRKTSEYPEGDTFSNLRNIVKRLDDKSFILDITTDPTNTNNQIQSFFIEKNGYQNWTNFVINFKKDTGAKIIPTIQSSTTPTLKMLFKQIKELSEHFKTLALRISAEDFYAGKDLGFRELAEKIIAGVPDDIFLIIIVDARDIRMEKGVDFSHSDFVRSKDTLVELNEILLKIRGQSSNQRLFILSSSFPASINNEHGGDAQGEARLFELEFYRKLTTSLDIKQLGYGDYGCIHSFQKPFQAFNWVPRIDFPLDNECIYFRHRDIEISEGNTVKGYTKAAKELITSAKFQDNKIECWGVEQIKKTAVSDKPAGGNPSFWISVRANIWITRIASKFQS